jgi:Amt family ammonium transporter
MDGYCTKPLDAKQLLAQIETFLKRPAPASSQPEQPPAEVTVSPTPTEGPSQRPAIIVDTLLERCMNNLSTIERVVSKFEQQSKRDAEQIRKSLEGSDATAAMRAAHSLKGAAGIVAAEGIASVAAEIERFGREQQIDLMNRSLSRLDEEVRRCIAYLPHVRTMAKEKLSSAATAPPEVRS